MTDGDKIAAAILASSADQSLTATRFNTMPLQDLYKYFLKIVTEADVQIPQQRMSEKLWLRERQQANGD